MPKRKGGRPRKTRVHKVYGRVDDDQKKKLAKIIDERGGLVDQSDIVSVALDFLILTSEKYPLGPDLVPQVPWKELKVS